MLVTAYNPERPRPQGPALEKPYGKRIAMQILDLEALDRAELRHDPCDFVVVPNFVRAEVLESVNRDYPNIDEAGNFAPDSLSFGPAFQTLLEELNSPELKAHYEKKFGTGLNPYPLQMTVRRYSEGSDGNVHNDSKNKIITSLIYFNQHWDHDGGRLRLCRSSWDVEDFSAEVLPVKGTLLAFKRSETSFHGFKSYEGERRSLQMYWVKPKRQDVGEAKSVSVKRLIKRLLKHRPRFRSKCPA